MQEGTVSLTLRRAELWEQLLSWAQLGRQPSPFLLASMMLLEQLFSGGTFSPTQFLPGEMQCEETVEQYEDTWALSRCLQFYHCHCHKPPRARDPSAGGLRSVEQSRRFQQSGIEVISFALIKKIAHVPSECPVRAPEADSLPWPRTYLDFVTVRGFI